MRLMKNGWKLANVWNEETWLCSSQLPGCVGLLCLLLLECRFIWPALLKVHWCVHWGCGWSLNTRVCSERNTAQHSLWLICGCCVQLLCVQASLNLSFVAAASTMEGEKKKKKSARHLVHPKEHRTWPKLISSSPLEHVTNQIRF